MAYMANLDTENVVLQVVSVNNSIVPDPMPENEAAGEAFLNSLGLTGRWIQTSFNADSQAAKRYNFAGIGYTYDAVNDAFIAPQPYPSWVLNDVFQWMPPVPYPQDGASYSWNEQAQQWDLVVDT